MAMHKRMEFRRNEREKHIARRKKICHYFKDHPAIPVAGTKWCISDTSKSIPFEYYKYDGQYDKGKIHCSCPLCKPGRKQRRPSEKEKMAVRLAELREKDFLDEETSPVRVYSATDLNDMSEEAIEYFFGNPEEMLEDVI